MKKLSLMIYIVIAVAFIGCQADTQVLVTPSSTQTISREQIEIKGSDTLLQMVSNLAEAYSKTKPNTRISVTGGGSGTGIAALINGEIDVADASRPIKQAEIEQAAAKGIETYEFAIARDMLSVIVHKDNSVDKLTKEQVGQIFRGELENWREVGGEDKAITLYGRQSTSGTYAFFMENVLEGDYSSKMRNLEGNQAILDAVRQDSSGIGYVGIGYLKDESGNQVGGVNIIKVANDDKSAFISPLDEKNLSRYPISRFLFQYFAGKPSAAAKKFLLFELSEEGQVIVKESGFVTLTAADQQTNEAALAQI